MRIEAGYSINPVVLSILFHLFVVTATMIGWPFLMKPAPTAQPLVIIDLVKLAPKTNLSAQSGKQKSVQNLSKKRQGANRLHRPPTPPPAMLRFLSHACAKASIPDH